MNIATPLPDRNHCADFSRDEFQITNSGEDGICISQRHPRYFEMANEKCWIPIGLNLCFPRFNRTLEEGLARYEQWIRLLAANGGNFIRIWLGHPFFDIEPNRAGEFDEDAAQRLDSVLTMADSHGIRVKITLEHFRTIAPRQEAEIFPGAASFSKSIYARTNGGYADDMVSFLNDPACRLQYLKKIDWLAQRFAAHPAIFGWELWNEMNAVSAPAESWLDWTHAMLSELRLRFPGHLVMQSLGSCDSREAIECYKRYVRIPGSDLHQVHRYLDQGSSLSECRGPMDVLCADAIKTLRQFTTSPVTTPILLAECGAVEPHHSAPAHLYESDPEGILLHDQLFAPFFAGAAGPGHAWHWDFYVEKHNLWHHFQRFARAIEGFDPIAENANPIDLQSDQLRIYILRGHCQSLIWFRDIHSNWHSELVEERPAQTISNASIPLSKLVPSPSNLPQQITFYDPWTDTEKRLVPVDARIPLPSFLRSCVIRVHDKSERT